MLEKAELTLIKMLSKTKKVITTSPPVLCSIASCNYYFTEVEDCEYFHYYLCRQLKGGGMEIKMRTKKQMRRNTGIWIVVVLIVLLFIGREKFNDLRDNETRKNDEKENSSVERPEKEMHTILENGYSTWIVYWDFDTAWDEIDSCGEKLTDIIKQLS